MNDVAATEIAIYALAIRPNHMPKKHLVAICCCTDCRRPALNLPHLRLLSIPAPHGTHRRNQEAARSTCRIADRLVGFGAMIFTATSITPRGVKNSPFSPTNGLREYLEGIAHHVRGIHKATPFQLSDCPGKTLGVERNTVSCDSIVRRPCICHDILEQAANPFLDALRVFPVARVEPTAGRPHMSSRPYLAERA